MKAILSVLLAVSFLTVSAQKPQHYYVEVKTARGPIIIQLHNETPLHRDNFQKLALEGFYDSLLFHRVIKNFMIQGGDPTSKHAKNLQEIGKGGPSYRIPAEIHQGIFHRKGAVGAARDNNPQKESSGSQFYIVQGRKHSEASLDSIEIFRMNGIKFSDEQKEVYKTIGGAPHLDSNYTVFGQVVSGIEFVDEIAGVLTNDKDRPLVDERIFVRPLTKLEAINIERASVGLKPKKRVSKGSRPYSL